MALITEFPLFQHLPPEIRIQIWELLPQPTRVIGLLPPASTWYRQYRRIKHPDHGHQFFSKVYPYDYRYIVQPRRQAVFPPLHVNREARRVWLPRFSKPPRYYQVSGLNIRFDTPFISYNTDLFTIFDGWLLNIHEHWPDAERVFLDCFIGLERSRVRNIALCEIPMDFGFVASAMSINTLPNLETFTILALGPDVFNQRVPTISRDRDGDMASGRLLEMAVVDAQRTPCKIYDLSTDIVRTNRFFNDKRLRHPVALSPEIRPLHRYKTFIRSWLWHEIQANKLNTAADQIEELWQEYMEYLFNNDEDGKCPLTLDGCGSQGHAKREILEWECPFLIEYKLLYADMWQEDLRRYGIIT